MFYFLTLLHFIFHLERKYSDISYMCELVYDLKGACVGAR